MRRSDSTRGRRSALGTLRSFRARSTLEATVSQGNSAASWNMSAVRPSTSIAAGGRTVQAGDEVEEGALAAPRGADEAHELAGRDVEVDVVDGGDRSGPPP